MMKKRTKRISMLLVSAILLSVSAGALGACTDRKKWDQLYKPEIAGLETTATTIIVTCNESGVEYGIDGENWQDEKVITGLSPSTEYTFYARYKETEDTYAGSSYTEKVTTLKLTQNMPAVSFEQANKTVTVEANAALEYSFDGGTTYVSENTFTYTEKGDKVIKVRFKETEDKYNSEEQVLNVCISDFFGGDGTEGNPFLIADKQQLLAINGVTLPSARKCFKLLYDIDFSESAAFAPLNCSYFDGNGKKLLSPTVTVAKYMGVFGQAGTIKNLTIEDASITANITTPNNLSGEISLSLLVGQASHIVDCHTSGEVSVTSSSANAYRIGGLVGYLANGVTINHAIGIERSSAEVSVGFNSSHVSDGVISAMQVGGLAGYCSTAETASITQSYATVDFNLNGVRGGYIGGIAGIATADILNCWASGDIATGTSSGTPHSAGLRIGGIAGEVRNGNVEFCYAAMNMGANGINVNTAIAGIVMASTQLPQPPQSPKRIANCFFSGNMSITTGGGKTAELDTLVVTLSATYTQTNCYHYLASENASVVTSKTTAVEESAMKTVAWQRDTLLFGTDIWNFTEGEYPTLK
jgi:hypothetical protein